MRDAFGGMFMIRIFLIFVLIYILLTAVAMNYAKAYKVKELVISYLEDNEIADINDIDAETEEKMLDYFDKEIIGSLNYTYNVEPTECGVEPKCKTFRYGIKIVQNEPNENESNKKGSYYTVTTYFGFDLGFLQLLAAGQNNPNITKKPGRWEISGETRLIFDEEF